MIPDDTLEHAAKLADRYITDRFLPDKAIDVIDEAGARARIASQVPPPEVEGLKDQLAEIGQKKKQRLVIRISNGLLSFVMRNENSVS